eukprot:m.22775 g.22775  ORF g.22775 m.22775 type:complete len:566 (-) comp4028_c0_seq1:108-1805(-)
MSTAKALYDFVGDTANGELSFKAGDIIAITAQDVGEGWWEGSVNGGEPGLLPASYVEVSDVPAGPPPTPPSAPPVAAPAAAPTASPIRTTAPPSSVPPPSSAYGVEQPPSDDEGDFSDDGDDDGWEDDADDGSDEEPAARGAPARGAAKAGHHGGADNFGRSGTLKRSNRFRASAFVKAGAEDYMIGIDNVKVRDSEKVTVEVTKGQGVGWSWPGGGDPNPNEVKVDLGDRKKSTFSSKQMFNITYNGNIVQRRSKHFQWLHDRLAIKYSCICVPPLPDKTYNPKFGETADVKRREKLQRWLRRIMRHPVLRQDHLSLQHFLNTNYAQTADWKKKKKDAEKDPLVGGNFFLMVDSDIPCPGDAMKTIDTFGAFVKEMKQAVTECIHHSMQHSQRMAGAIRKEYQMLGSGYDALSKVCTKANTNDGDAIKLSMALTGAAAKMEACANLVKVQPAKDELPWIDGLKEYVGMLSQFGDAIHSSKAAEKRFQEVDKVEGQVADKEKDMLRTRLERIHTVTLCEVHHFHESLKRDLKAMMQAYFQAQIDHQQALIDQLAAAKKGFDDLPF